MHSACAAVLTAGRDRNAWPWSPPAVTVQKLPMYEVFQASSLSLYGNTVMLVKSTDVTEKRALY